MPIVVLNSCENDDGSDPVFGEDEVYIYGDWSQTLTCQEGTDLVVAIGNVSPVNDLKFEWTLDGTKISDKKDLLYKIPLGTPSEGTLIFKAIRSSGAFASRQCVLTITPAN